MAGGVEWGGGRGGSLEQRAQCQPAPFNCQCEAGAPVPVSCIMTWPLCFCRSRRKEREQDDGETYQRAGSSIRGQTGLHIHPPVLHGL